MIIGYLDPYIGNVRMHEHHRAKYNFEDLRVESCTKEDLELLQDAQKMTFFGSFAKSGDLGIDPKTLQSLI